MERWVERPFLDAEEIRRDALNVRRNRVPVHWSLRVDGAQDDQSKRALEDIILASRHDT